MFMRASSSGGGLTYPRSMRLRRLRDSLIFAHNTLPGMPAASRFVLRSDIGNENLLCSDLKADYMGIPVGIWMGCKGVKRGFQLFRSLKFGRFVALPIILDGRERFPVMGTSKFLR